MKKVLTLAMAFHGACELKRKVPAFARVSSGRTSARLDRVAFGARWRALPLALFLITFSPLAIASGSMQEHPPAGEHAADGGHDESIAGMIKGMAWPVANFIIFLGVIYYFGNKPFAEYLNSRSAAIRRDLVEAAELKATAQAQLAQIEQKLQALPGEIDALRRRGAEDIKAEEQRIAAAAAADRERLLEQTRREIDLQVRLAKKELLEHAADLSLQLATDRIRKEVTPEDQARLVDRYLTQVKDQ